MKRKDIATATQLKDRKLAILVDSDYVASFYKHLKTLGVECNQPSEAIFGIGHAYVNRDGKCITDVQATVHEIKADGTIEEFEEWIDAWDFPIL